MNENRRAFNKSEKQLLFIQSRGLCSNCGKELPRHWHGDHVQPFSKGGLTILSNGQALCPECNLAKSNNMNIELREWQQEFIQLPFKFYRDGKRSFFCHAGIGSGKTRAAVLAAIEFLKSGRINNIVVFSPSEDVKINWADEFHLFNYELDCNFDYLRNYKREYNGISITYQGLTANANWLLNSGLVDSKTLIICDEPHHLGDKKQWGNDVQRIGEKAGFTLLLTGTPYRSDNNKIPFANYTSCDIPKQYKLEVDYSYSYADSIIDEVCCPTSFYGIKINHSLAENGVLTEKQNHLFNYILDANESSFVRSMYLAGDKILSDLRAIMPNAAGLIVCKSIKDAEKLGEQIPDSVVITSAESDSTDIKKFSDGNKKWVITVKMISEGVNVPRIRVIVYAHNCTTPLFFEQVIGRGVRNRNDKKLGTCDHCYCIYPDYEPLIINAKNIEEEIRHIIEEQEKESKEYKERQEALIHDDIFYEVYAGEKTLINAGQNLSEWVEFCEAMPIEKSSRFQRKLAEALRLQNNILQPQPQILKKTDRVKYLRKEIHKLVNKIHYATQIEQKKIHNWLNRKCNVGTMETEHNEDRLQQKLNYAIEELNNNGAGIRGGNN